MSLARALLDLVEAHGYLVVALGVGIESSGVPFPGETIVVVAATYAGRTHRLELPWIVAAASAGAIVGDNLGFLAGRVGGFPLLVRYVRRVRADERRLKLGIWLFRRYGAVLVFFGRFVAVLRAWAAILAGANRMPWGRFLAANSAGGVLWASAVACAAFAFGRTAARIVGALGWVLLAMGMGAAFAAFAFLKRNEQRLLAEADRAIPGPIDPAAVTAAPPETSPSEARRGTPNDDQRAQT
jgi:membrane protein DedA with SNARE-associated domain